jgi:hypothetical protein
MKYTVVWETTAETELAELWLRVRDRETLTRAGDRIDVVLQTSPSLRGEPHSSQRRILIEPPLGVIFRIEEDDRLVRVLAVWYIPAGLSNGFTKSK